MVDKNVRKYEHISEELGKHAADFTAAATALRALLKRIKGATGDMVSGVNAWKGTSSDNFQKAWENFSDDTDASAKAMDDTASILEALKKKLDTDISHLRSHEDIRGPVAGTAALAAGAGVVGTSLGGPVVGAIAAGAVAITVGVGSAISQDIEIGKDEKDIKKIDAEIGKQLADLLRTIPIMVVSSGSVAPNIPPPSPGGNSGGNNQGGFPGGHNPSGNPGGNPGGNNQGGFPGGHNPGGNPGGNNPGGNPGGNDPSGNHPGSKPPDKQDLTDQENQILALIAAGLSIDAIATRLGITRSSVNSVIASLVSKRALESAELSQIIADMRRNQMRSQEDIAQLLGLPLNAVTNLVSGPPLNPHITEQLEQTPQGRHALWVQQRYDVTTVWGVPGGGTWYERNSNTVVLDPTDPAPDVSFIHEATHAEYTRSGRAPDPFALDQDDYVDAAISEEVDAEVNVANYIMNHPGHNTSNAPGWNIYSAVYEDEFNDEYNSTHDAAAARAAAEAEGRQALYGAFRDGSIHASVTGASYAQYYADVWNKWHGITESSK